jgi:hypothetical protein
MTRTAAQNSGLLAEWINGQFGRVPSSRRRPVEPGLRFALYGRISTREFQDQKSSLSWQREAALELTTDRGAIVASRKSGKPFSRMHCENLRSCSPGPRPSARPARCPRPHPPWGPGSPVRRCPACTGRTSAPSPVRSVSGWGCRTGRRCAPWPPRGCCPVCRIRLAPTPAPDRGPAPSWYAWLSPSQRPGGPRPPVNWSACRVSRPFPQPFTVKKRQPGSPWRRADPGRRGRTPAR